MQKAFSLVELSIVLVILGLLTGGILAGQSLIRAAELRSVGSEYQKYSSAIYAFRDKYLAYPGDMTNATQFWGALDGGDGVGLDCFSLETSSRLTCNGNGDGQMNSAGVALPYESGERYQAWVHLSNAALVEGTYSGRTDSTAVESARTPGKMYPVANFKLMDG